MGNPPNEYIFLSIPWISHFLRIQNTNIKHVCWEKHEFVICVLQHCIGWSHLLLFNSVFLIQIKLSKNTYIKTHQLFIKIELASACCPEKPTTRIFCLAKVIKSNVFREVKPSNYMNLIAGQGPILLPMDVWQVCVCAFTS